jgi:hypothetical protein
MDTKLIMVLAAMAAGAGTFAALRGTRATPKNPSVTDDVKSWENEGGNVPAVPTPSP